MLKTRLTEMFGLEYPIVSAPMALHSGGTLAAAVSEAGGLGAFGGIDPKGPDWVREQIELVQARTQRPFGVGYISAFIPFMEQHFAAAIDARVPVIALSFGDAQPWLGRAKEAGILVMCQVQTFAEALAVAGGGADVVVAQGNEGGGHSGPMNLLPLLTRVVEALPDVPVLAAGGITSGRALAAVLAAGADGAWLGTALLATPEAVEVTDQHKRLVVDSDGEDTVFTRVFDIVEGYPWPEDIGGRVHRNRFVQEWDGREAELEQRREELSQEYRSWQQEPERHPDRIPHYFGQGAAAVQAVRPAAEVVREICDDAERILRDRARQLLD
jgi:nitronate monooxygenase